MNHVEQQFSDAGPMVNDFFRMFCGELLGQGSGRAVYRHKHNPKMVIKIEKDREDREYYEFCSERYQNIMEWETWDRIRHTDFACWFAPCHFISPCGRIMIQSYAKDMTYKTFPKEVPAFFTDLKASNWGLYKGKPVARDYGIHLLMEVGMTKKMRKWDGW